MNAWALVVIVTMMAGGADGGSSVQVREVGRYSRASCEAAAKDIEARATFTHWAYGDVAKGGRVITKAFCIAAG